MSFETLNLNPQIQRAIKEEGYTQPTPIQAQAIPTILDGKDLLAAAQTGTGKTAAFTLPMLQKLSSKKGEGKRYVRALVLTPTRELAAQVHQSVRTYGKYLKLKSVEIYGGVSIQPQTRALRNGVDILVATPGRLLDHVNQGHVDLSKVEVLVLDEADRMLDMGFINDIKKIIADLPHFRQNLLFSATFSDEIKRLSKSILKEPEMIKVAADNTTADRIKQTVHPVDKAKKADLLSHLIGSNNWQQVLVFTRTKHGADKLSKRLAQDGLPSTSIHGNKTQAARMKALKAFKDGRVRVLVATDVAARGIDIDKLGQVVNFDLPEVAEDYVHRIGRTGRAGNAGEAFSLVCIDERHLLHRIEKLTSSEIEKVLVDGYHPDPSIKAEPVKKRGGNGRRRSFGSRNHAEQHASRPHRSGNFQRKSR
ncbi:DEAD/DEAH box helicase [Hydrogenimonas cancrithermarum]|uniref:ATP-dependent RNA helicase RhlE n=1 Tax=Hydrogenimonas cancrithermarum TaxID=2993563 RepID=A0ABN6WYH3_9BACT|nr:DEAD/DEAH box helicase [Hydrogenimonas cancrithermarum]BDY13247.1 ATP-dependent RNA helicase RhlE [Hydrogenimonas cancrithermarum]